jgi:hypothetical protein
MQIFRAYSFLFVLQVRILTAQMCKADKNRAAGIYIRPAVEVNTFLKC